MTTPTRRALSKSPALRACVAYEATQKPEVEREERKEHESPPVALRTEEDGDEENPRREKGAHDDRLFGVLTRPGVDPAAGLFVCRHFVTTILGRGANGSSGTGSGGRLPLARRVILRQHVDQPHEGMISRTYGRMIRRHEGAAAVALAQQYRTAKVEGMSLLSARSGRSQLHAGGGSMGRFFDPAADQGGSTAVRLPRAKREKESDLQHIRRRSSVGRALHS
jgi:hypothetical protein